MMAGAQRIMLDLVFGVREPSARWPLSAAVCRLTGSGFRSSGSQRRVPVAYSAGDGSSSTLGGASLCVLCFERKRSSAK
jgi:hypothetical protein